MSRETSGAFANGAMAAHPGISGMPKSLSNIRLLRDWIMSSEMLISVDNLLDQVLSYPKSMTH